MTNPPNSYDAFPLPTDPSLGGVASAGGEPPKRPRGRRKRRVFRWIGFVLVTVLLAAGGYAFYNYQRFVGGVTHVDAIPESDGSEDFDGVDQNILLVGDDHRPVGATAEELAMIGTEANGGGKNTDSMLLLHLPADGSEATVISFPRDSWVEVPGHGKNKLNAAFAIGAAGGDEAAGARLLIQTIQDLSGLTVDHYVRVSLLGFYKIVDALGPVEVCLNNAVNDPYSTINLPAGVSTLNAQQALAFVRQRHGLPNGDLDRQVRQQYFLSVEARKILSAGTLLNPGKLGNVLDAVSSSVETDPGLNFLQLAYQVRNLGADNITTATIPVAGTPTITVGGDPLSIVEVDLAAMPAFINELVGTPSAYEEAVAAPVGEVTVAVLNGGSADGAAGAATETLATAGFQTVPAASATAAPTTTIQYPAGQEAAAKAVAAYLPGAAVAVSDAVDTVTVVLGGDLMTVAAAPPAAPPADAPAAPVDPAKPPVGTTYAAGACIN